MTRGRGPGRSAPAGSATAARLLDEAMPERRVPVVVAEQVGRDAVGHPQGAAQEGALAVLDDSAGRRTSGASAPAGPAVCGGLRDPAQAQGQPDARRGVG